MPRENIRTAVCGQFDDFKTSKVRDFVPILVQRLPGPKLPTPGSTLLELDRNDH